MTATFRLSRLEFLACFSSLDEEDLEGSPRPYVIYVPTMRLLLLASLTFKMYYEDCDLSQCLMVKKEIDRFGGLAALRGWF